MKLVGQFLIVAITIYKSSLINTVLGGSTTQLFRILSFTLNFQPEDEIIVSSIDHEANIAPWVGLAKRQNLKLKWWTPAPSSNPVLQASDLDALLSPRTRLVTCTHASNLLGTIHDVRSIADKVHTIPGAKLCVDGVAYAPHRQIDVKAFGVDFYSFSWYKVYGPHMALLYAKKDAHELIDPLTHFFNPQATLADKLSLAASNYEITASLPTLTSYFGSDLKKTFEGFAEQESKLQGILLDYLNAHEGVMLFGSPSKDSSVRVPTISFTVKGKGQLEIMDTVEKNTPFGFRAGHMYSKRLCDDVLKVNQEGVVRVSFVHYNTGKWRLFCRGHTIR